MSLPVWQSTIVHIGSGAAEMFDAGVYIFFGQPCPDALAEVSLVHDGPEDAFVPIQPGDEICVAGGCVQITEVGSLANPNFEQLGHIVVYLNVAEASLLPGAVKAVGTLPLPSIGDRVEIRRRTEAP